MENKCPKCGEDSYYCDDGSIEQDGDTLWIDRWCRCCSCGQRWKYTERFTLDIAWIETEEEED
jgi:transcriptional regulator NrdR family protein|nr:MAG TPA: alpha-aminoadipate carrier protein [Caudoviricetes sp.]